uniref:V-SNARE coiled-coil homology domain-containing protein n=1 Tax=Pinguiococcus pyrenoidosus TaxID=172671 RepID=A0A7R9U6L8_9STRA|mmetsp:Transcript_17021/g.64899  ORF Transcript_17021/g.64899 Transcript_17021/m.64899 type:complete len:263 (+) Transcript_17021:73-861(+)
MASFIRRLNSPSQETLQTAARDEDVLYVGVTYQPAEATKEWGVVRSAYEAPRVLGEAGRTADPDVQDIYQRLLARKPAPGWDEISRGSLRAVKCPIHSVDGVTNFCCVFDANADPKRVQVFLEKLVLMLNPVVADHVAADQDESERKNPAATQTQLQEVLSPNLEREINHINSNKALEDLGRKVDDVKRIMIANVDAILERQEKLENLEDQSRELMDASRVFRTNARRLKRWHLMNQVKWGLAIGTVVTASIAIPIVIIAVA